MDAAAEDVVDLAQAVQVEVYEGDAGSHAEGDFGGVGADDASADDADVARGGAGDAAEQNAAAAVVFFEIGGADLDAHASGDLAHRGEQRQVAGAVADGLIGDAGDFFLEQGVGESAERSEVEVGEEDEAFAEVAVLGLGGLFDFDDHVGEAPDVIGGADDFSAGGLEVVVGEGGECAGVGFDEDFVAAFGESFDSSRGDAYATLVIFYFFGYADNHLPCLPKPCFKYRIVLGAMSVLLSSPRTMVGQTDLHSTDWEQRP